MKRYKAAAIIIIIHGMIEIGGFFAVLPLWFGAEMGAFVPFDPPATEILIVGVIWGVIRLIAGIGLWKNRMWALVLSVITCVMAISSMLEILPFGIMDGIFGATALILILTQYFGIKKAAE